MTESPRSHHCAEGLVRGQAHRGQVQAHRPDPGTAQHVERNRSGAAVHHHLRGPGIPGAGENGRQPRGQLRCIRGPHGAAPAGCAEHAALDRGERGLVELGDHRRARDRPVQRPHMTSQRLPERLGQLRACSGIGEDARPTSRLQPCGQGPRTGHLQLDRSGKPRDLLLEPVAVLLQPRGSPAHRPPRLRTGPTAGEPPPVGVVWAANSPVAKQIRASVRPSMSAPGPRAGSSGRCGTSSSPATIRAASTGSVPGIDPIPVTCTARGSSAGSSIGTGPLSRSPG